MEVKNKFLVAIGIVLIGMALIGVVGIIMKPGEVEYPGPIYTPAIGTEGFVFGNPELTGEWTAVGTGLYEHLGDVKYGTLWTAESGEWVIVDPRGQIPASGSVGTPIPEVKT